MSGAVQVTGVFDPAAYVIKARIGTGQFGTVHRAWWPARGIDVALKHVRADGPDGGIKVHAEERGAALQQHFSSRYPDLVPEVFECGRADGGDYYIAMELVDGRPLGELIRASRLAPREAAELALAVADFLVKLHGLSDGQEPILHSDLKPEHVLVRADGGIRILDLGIAKSLQADKSLTSNAWASAPYASPERLDDGQVRAGDDLWALGVMLFEMVSGVHPYHQYMSDDNNATLARAIRRTEPPAPLPSSCDPGLAAAICKMLAPQPVHRYQSASEIAADLRSFLDGRETLARSENVRASSRTQVIPSSPPAAGADLSDTVPTEPLPAGYRVPSAPDAPRSRLARSLTAIRRAGSSPGVLRRAGAALLIVIALAEASAWVRAERFLQRVGGLQPSDVPAARAEVDRMRRLAPFALAVPLRVRDPLREQMTSLADRAILDFRNDLLVTEVQWRHAQTSLALAMNVAPNDRQVAARARYVDGHLVRIAAQRQSASIRQARLNEAKSRFIESARLDPSSPDPYLGLARVNAYETRDFEALQVNITEAEARGYKPGRRERAQLGDGFKFRAERALAQSRSASGEGRRRFLESAASDYESCAAKFEGLGGYFDSERNLAYCEKGLVRVKTELQGMEARWPFSLFGITDARRSR